MTSPLSWPHSTDWPNASGPPSEATASRMQDFRLLRLQMLLSSGDKKLLLIDQLRALASTLYNGPAPVIGGKYEFLEIARALGYDAPAGFPVYPGQMGSEVAGAIRALDPRTSRRFCKPLHGSMSRGVHFSNSVEDALAFVRRRRVPYVIQEVIPPARELRYILSRTVADIEANRPPSVRIAYEKMGPWVYGSGLARAVRLARKICWRDPLSGSRLCYRRLIGGAELAGMDAYMLQFLADYEHHIGAQLVVLCVDVGLTSDGRRVFYEQQFPFGNPYKWMAGDYAGAGRALHTSMLYSAQAAHAKHEIHALYRRGSWDAGLLSCVPATT